ncbi:PH domain-containing protein [Acidipropionibacterium jensenii]|uniref:PH domain-containing protein n=1 Tax=Acidipropionibacterium jensenii TaxID=1749 RepID=UPI00214AEA29|nr:PH domain-containing protein [Acidipropionibacterium jensenii]
MDDLFDPPGGQWQPISSRYISVRRLLVVVDWGLLTAVLVLGLGFIWSWWAGLVAGVVGLAWTTWRWFRMPRIVAAWGWCERGTDLCIRSGPWFRTLRIVPYGRMQAVEINAGPLDRHFSLASVRLVTASPASDAVIPGMPAQEATALRDRITAVAETADAGL